MNLLTLSKFTATTILLTTITSVSFAEDSPCKVPLYKDAAPCVIPKLKDGFYMGLQAGYDSFRLPSSTTGPGGSFSTTGSIAGLVGGLFMGYGKYFNNNTYLGAEILGNYDGHNQTLASGSNDDGDTILRVAKAKATLGLSILPGLKLNNASLGFLRLGYDWTNFHLNTTGIDGGTGASFSINKNSTLGGLDLGLGIETLLCQNWSVRTEYNHIFYTSMSAGDSVTGTNTSINPSDNQFMLGLVYHTAA